MKSLKPSLNTRLAAYAAAGAAVVVTGGATSSEAAIVYYDPPNITVPQNGTGVYIDLVTNQTSTTGSFTGYDINPYGSTTLLFFAGAGTGYVAPTTAGPASVLMAGTPISAASTYTTSSSGTNFQVTGTELLGIRFVNTTTGVTNYGWIEFTTTATTGYPATVNRWAYENTGGSILAGQTAVPEPGTNAAMAMGALALGALGVRRWKQGKQAVA